MRTYRVNEEMSNYLEMYCMGKSKIWNLFFGWRKSITVGINDCWYYYKVPKKVYKEAKNFVEMYKTI